MRLRARNVSRSFPGVRALHRVDLDVAAGEIHALVGENGAGKSTLGRILAGAIAPDQGTIELDGKTASFDGPRAAQAAGVWMVHQELALAPNLTVAENILVGALPSRAGLVRWRALFDEARRVLEPFGAGIPVEAPAGSLGPGRRQLVEIARAVAHRPRVLVLDEPTSSLEEREAGTLLGVLRRLAADGLSIVYVSHKLDEIFALAARVTVLRDGERVDTCDTPALTRADLIRKMVGREIRTFFPDREPPGVEEALRVEGLGREGAFEEVSFAVRRGEIVGLAGLVGAGRTEVLQALFGRRPADRGRILLRGVPARIGSPADAIALGIACLPEERKTQGLFPDMSLQDNLMALPAGGTVRAGFIDAAATRRHAEATVARFGVRAASVDRPVRTLSGGNQQKLLLGRWLARRPEVLLADEPTRGIDIGAKAEIYRMLRDLARAGTAVVFVSSELPELLGLCDRIVVLHEGRVAGALDAAGATEEAVMHLAAGPAPAGQR